MLGLRQELEGGDYLSGATPQPWTWTATPGTLCLPRGWQCSRARMPRTPTGPRETHRAGHAWKRPGPTTGTGGPGRLGAVRTWSVWAVLSTEDRGQRRPPLLLDRERGGQQVAVRTVLLQGNAPELGVSSLSEQCPQLIIIAQALG